MGVFLRWIGRGVFASAVAAVVAFSMPSAAVGFECPGVSPGMCPPLNATTCFEECGALGYLDGGICMVPGSGCCTCFE